MSNLTRSLMLGGGAAWTDQTGTALRRPDGTSLALSLGGGSDQRPILVSYIGDSISTRDQPTVSSGINGPRADGIGKNLEMLSMGAMQLHTCRATGGYTIQDCIDNHLAGIISDAPDAAFVLAGTNDCYSALTPASAATIFASLRDGLWLPLVNAGIRVFAHTIPPCGSRSTAITAVQRAAAEQVNYLIRAYRGVNPMIHVVDLSPVLSSADGAQGGTRSGMYVTTDPTYLHPNDSGAIVYARERWKVAQQIGLSVLPGERMSVDSPYSIGVNPAGAGNNASGANRTVISAGVTGTGPHGWAFNRSGTASAVVTPGAVSRTDGRDGQLVQVAFTGGSAGDSVKVIPIYNGGGYITGSSSVAVRQNSTPYVPGELRRFSNGLFYKALNLGTSTSSEPGSLPTTVGGIVVDGTVTWVKTPEVVAGSWVRTVVELYVTAHATEAVFFQAGFQQYTVAYGNLAAGVVFESANGSPGTTEVAGGGAGSYGSVFSHSITGYNGYAVGALPLNTTLRCATPWVQIASDCGIIEPRLRIIGGAAATATLQISHLGVEIRA